MPVLITVKLTFLSIAVGYLSQLIIPFLLRGVRRVKQLNCMSDPLA